MKKRSSYLKSKIPNSTLKLMFNINFILCGSIIPLSFKTTADWMEIDVLAESPKTQ